MDVCAKISQKKSGDEALRTISWMNAKVLMCLNTNSYPLTAYGFLYERKYQRGPVERLHVRRFSSALHCQSRQSPRSYQSCFFFLISVPWSFLQSSLYLIMHVIHDAAAASAVTLSMLCTGRGEKWGRRCLREPAYKNSDGDKLISCSFFSASPRLSYSQIPPSGLGGGDLMHPERFLAWKIQLGLKCKG